VAVQILLGITMEIFGTVQMLQLFHLWVATLYPGFVLILYTELGYQPERV
jgi:hypothetical protein